VKLINLSGRLAIVVDGKAIDVEQASKGVFTSDVQASYARFAELSTWAASFKGEGNAFDRAELGSPVPKPGSVFAIGVNYRDHAAESNLPLPEKPMVFTKFPASITGPYNDITLPQGFVDFEVELVAVIGKSAAHVSSDRAWNYVAGLTVGQDVSERELQTAGSPPQFSLGKSFTGFAPMGPMVVSIDEFKNPDDLELGCSIDGVVMQRARTSLMVHSIPKLVAFLSSVLTLAPGDIIFTGTPAGVGWGRKPRRQIAANETLTTFAEGIGEMTNKFVQAGN
jgi:2-keto-4-pentenoate hydratase/2-oxohepta-3-ene-1,7-dioic acid hydratase in catechol pathway